MAKTPFNFDEREVHTFQRICTVMYLLTILVLMVIQFYRQFVLGQPQEAWNDIVDAAERHNSPGAFTAFIGFEWTSHPDGNNLHRVVVYRDDESKASVMEPYTTLSPFGSPDPRDLWKWMHAYQDKTGGRLLADRALSRLLKKDWPKTVDELEA